ncbi:hypothetical protein BSPLISOX_398 [uncultured Gammaproteobacteria bacterium]|nr:hypothetical protein BSPLISOX_398 [uncultured Gammaproteobacteria bacterium]
MAVFYKIVKLVKNGVLMIIHIYAKVSFNKRRKKNHPKGWLFFCAEN